MKLYQTLTKAALIAQTFFFSKVSYSVQMTNTSLNVKLNAICSVSICLLMVEIF